MTATTQSALVSHFDAKTLAALGGLDFKARYVMEGFLAGLHESPFHGFSVEFSDYRDYQPGDDLKFIDWRLFARSDRLCIKRFLQETNVRFYVVCDSSASMGYRGSTAWGSKLDCARVVGAAMTWFLLRQNDAAGLIAIPDADTPAYVRPSQNPSQFGAMLHHLESLQPVGGACLGTLLQQTVRLAHRRSVILLFSDLLEPSAEVQLGIKQLRFHGHEVLVFQVLDRDELEFPFTEGSQFEDLETNIRRQVAPEAVRDRYLSRFNAFMEEHRYFFRSLDIPYCLVRTDSNPWKALAMFLAERKRLK